MSREELQIRVEEILEELCILNETIPIIVEGKKDEATLRQLGIHGVILRLNIGLSILNFCEEISRKYDKVILLPDWDGKGTQIFDKLVRNFKITGVKTVKKFWRDFNRFCSKEVKQVEYLTKFLRY